MRISDVVTYYDLSKLQKKHLQELCIELDESDKGLNDELAYKVWSHIQSDRKQLHKYENYLLAYRGSVSWYTLSSSILDEKVSLKKIREKLKLQIDNPFEKIIYYKNDQLTTTPFIFAATEPLNGTYFLRVALKDGNVSSLSMRGKDVAPKITLATVFVDENNNILEVRAPFKFAAKIAGELANFIGDDSKADKKNILTCFDSDMGNLANSLNGKIKESIDIPNQIVDDITDEQVKNIANILKSIDKAIQEDEATQLLAEIESSKSILLNDFPEISFLCLILAGLGKVRLGASIDDLRSSPLYDSISPFLENQGGYIEFSANDNGVSVDCLIQVGIKRQTINFSKFANESVIDTIRKLIFDI